jgi:hypothetical protein
MARKPSRAERERGLREKARVAGLTYLVAIYQGHFGTSNPIPTDVNEIIFRILDREYPSETFEPTL